MTQNLPTSADPKGDDGHELAELAAAADALRPWHRAALGVIAGCAIVIAVRAWTGDDTGVPPDAMPPRHFTLAAVGLAVATVGLRRLASSPVMALRPRVLLSLAALGSATALGLLAAALDAIAGQTQTALVFTLAAAIFILRPPIPRPPIPPAPHED